MVSSNPFCRVARRLTAGTDENRQTIHEAGYVQALSPVLKQYTSKLASEQELNEVEFGCVRAIIASLMNISLGSYGTFEPRLIITDHLAYVFLMTSQSL